MKIHVAIATTQGPVFVQELTQEEPDVAPTVCINGTSKQLALSNPYTDFVRKGSGLIERDFGYAAWRMDITDNIDAGDSWQLGVYLAHFLNSQQQLGNGQVQAGDRVILATGAVKYSGEVTSVDHIATKLEAALPHLNTWQEAGAEVCLLMHPGNMNLITPETHPSLSSARQLRVNNVTELSSLIHVKTARGTSTIKSGRSNNGREGRPLYYAIIVVVIALGITALAAWQKSTNDVVVDAGADEKPAIDEQKRGEDPTSVSPDSQDDEGDDPSKVKARSSLDDFGSIAREPLADGPAPATIEVWTSEEPWLCFSRAMKVELFTASGRYFEPVTTGNLCGLKIHQTRPEQRSVYLYALDSGAFRELSWTNEKGIPGWEIPTPSQTRVDRNYCLIITESYLNAAMATSLKQTLDANKPYGADPASKISAAIGNIELSAEVYGHTLLRR